MLIGQSYRAEPNPFVPPGSGMDQRLSDVVGRVVLTPNAYLDMIYRFRLDKATLGNRGQELALNVGPTNLKFGTSFLLIPAEQPSQLITVPGSGNTILYGKREQLGVGLNAKLTRYWSLSLGETINLSNASNIVNGVVTPQANSTTLQSAIAAIYQDECMAFIATASQSAIRNGDVTPGYTVMFSILFKNIGQIGGNLLSVSPGQ
jgi:LPS-assembly protein